MDSATEDEEILLLKQSSRYLQELGDSFRTIETVSSERELENIIKKIEPYQEDPQLLDAELANFIPLLSDKFLKNLQQPQTLAYLSRILYTLCKVRGEKVILGLLNNEARWIEPLLDAFDGEQTDELPWDESYTLLLWLSHLMLTPFDLSTISSHEPQNVDLGFETPNDTPGITMRILQMGTKHLRAATIERKAASNLLVRLCVRQDMLNLGILPVLARWAISTFKSAAAESQIHQCLGTLTFLSRLVASADQKELGSHLPAIFNLSHAILNEEAFSIVKSSAIARKLIIKIQRNTILHCLQAENALLDTTEVVEHVIGSLIELLSDSDTPVRMAAAKALSGITQKLDQEMATEVIEAVNATFNEDLAGQDANLFWGIDAAKWHGVVLTLGHFLHKRAASVDQLPDILKSILTALDFEQRSTTGKSVGANVRDAANYGLWAVARRYSTAEVQAFPIYPGEKVSSVQRIALQLLRSACFDPDGNVRRGSSAALQELIGRHPNTVIEGISLVQTVDYQSVGLRPRAATKVANAAARLNEIYYKAVTAELSTWRGYSSASLSNRIDVAIATGMLCSSTDSKNADQEIESDPYRPTMTDIATLLANVVNLNGKTANRDHEQRHGLLLAASWILSSLNRELESVTSGDEINGSRKLVSAVMKVAGNLRNERDDEMLSSTLFKFILSDDFKPRVPRAEMVITAALRLLGQLAQLASLVKKVHPEIVFTLGRAKHFALAANCLSRSDPATLEQIPDAIGLSTPLLKPEEADELVNLWLAEMAPENKRVGTSSDARVLALGAAFNGLSSGETQARILRFLRQRMDSADVDARIIVLQSVRLILLGMPIEPKADQTHIQTTSEIISHGLWDYTISERGDVGSLVRLASLAALNSAWSRKLLLNDDMRASVLRLSLEKLDRVRLTAVECWTSSDPQTTTKHQDDDPTNYLLTHGAPQPPTPVPVHDLSSTLYFSRFLHLLEQTERPFSYRLNILQGLSSTAGAAGSGASQTLLNAREALHTFLAEGDASRTAVFLSTLKAAIDLGIQSGNDQRLVAALEVTAFALEMGVLQHHAISPSPWRPFLSSIQKSHFKSKNIAKLQICLDAYRGLHSIEEIRVEVEKKVVSMLLHPLPAVRIYAAETLVTVVDGRSEEVVKSLVSVDWTNKSTELEAIVEGVRGQLGVT